MSPIQALQALLSRIRRALLLPEPARRFGQQPEADLPLVGRRLLVLLGAVVLALLESGFDRPALPLWLLRAGQTGLLLGFFADVWYAQIRKGRRVLRDEPTGPVTDAVLHSLVGIALLLSLLTWLVPIEHWLPVGRTWTLVEIGAGLLVVVEVWRLYVGLARRLRLPGLLFPASFALLILIGTLLLKLPRSVPPGQAISWIDALYTAASATCVTGLTVRPTGTGFSPLGQGVILVLIQLGGLGVIVFGAVLAALMGERFSVRENLGLSGMLGDLPLADTARIVRFMLLATLGVEAIGALGLLMTVPLEGSLADRLAWCVFHSVSAFCNAGFTLDPQSLIAQRYAMSSHLIVAPLIVLGGLGFPVLRNTASVARVRLLEAWRRWRYGPLGRRRALPAERRLNLHTRLVLATSIGLYLAGVLAIGAAQLSPYAYRWAGLSQTANAAELEPISARLLGGVLADASFMSISARTAGFNTLPMHELHPAAQYALSLLMMVGASPAGTGGGIKTTTFALLLLSIAATVRLQQETLVFLRSIADALIRKAATIAVALIGIVALMILLLMLSEPLPFRVLVFEAVSAATTTGLSIRDAEFSSFGKLVITAGMFLGRVGPLSLMVAMLRPIGHHRPYAYPHERVLLG
jgi:trk system potassium uptake protein TrkH